MKPPVSRRLLALVLLPLVLLLSACARYNETVDIRNEQDINVNLKLGVLRSTADAARINQQTICAQFKPGSSLVPQDAHVTRYEDDQYIGCTIEFKAIMTQLPDGMVTHRNRLWTFTLKPQLKDVKSVPVSLSAGDFSDFHVAVTFPGDVTQHSGGSTVSGRTVTWTQATDWMSDTGLHAEAKDALDLTAFAVIALGAVVLAGAGLTVAWLMRRARRRETAMQSYVDRGFERHHELAGDAEEIRRYYADPDRYRAITGAWAPPSAGATAYRPQQADGRAADVGAYPPSGASAYRPGGGPDGPDRGR